MTALEAAQHGLQCIVADAGKPITYLGKNVICTAELCREIAATLLAESQRLESEQATPIEFLAFFYSEADFGPADDDVRLEIEERFMEMTGKALPEGYGREE